MKRSCCWESLLSAGAGHRTVQRPAVSVSAVMLCLAWISLLGACASVPRGDTVGPTQMMQADAEIPEDQLLDVGVHVFEAEALSAEAAQKQGTTPEIRKAEAHFMAYHLKNTLQQSSLWGAVRVLPDADASADVHVNSRILHANGRSLVLEVTAVDAAGRRWFQRRYRQDVHVNDYDDLQKGQKDAFQNLYNKAANDLALYQRGLSPEEIRDIRRISRLKFAADFAPDAFKGYLALNSRGQWAVKRLPADDDPMMARLQKIREREYMYVDTLNRQYEGFYANMWPTYVEWRQQSLQELKIIENIKKDALQRALLGSLLVAGAVALGQSDADLTALQAGMVIVGGQIIIDGYNLTRGIQMHAEAIEELSESFGSAMAPVVMDFEGHRYELTGSAREQFQKWRDLLRRIWETETGLAPAVPQPDMNTP